MLDLLVLGLLTPRAAPNQATELSASLCPEFAWSPCELGVGFAGGGVSVVGSGGAAAGAKVATVSGSDVPTVSSGLIGSGCSSYEVTTGSSTVGSITIGEFACSLGLSSFEVPASATFRAIFSAGFSMGFNANRGVAAKNSICDMAC